MQRAAAIDRGRAGLNRDAGAETPQLGHVAKPLGKDIVADGAAAVGQAPAKR